MVHVAEKEFMIAGLRKQRDLLNDLVFQLRSKEELDKGARELYDQVTKEVERNLKQLKRLRRGCFEHQHGCGLIFDHPYKTKLKNH